jgi:hypothetical protein
MLRRLPSGGNPLWRAAFYGTGFHMLLRDLHAATVIGDVVHWIDDKSAPLPSGADAEARGILAAN